MKIQSNALSKVSIKELQDLFNCSERTAKRKKIELIQWYNDIKGTNVSVLYRYMLDEISIII